MKVSCTSIKKSANSPIEKAVVLVDFISFLLASLAGSVLFWVNKEQKHNNRTLGGVMFILALTNLNSYFLYSRLLLEYPGLHKIFLPLTFLIAPASYLYIRSVLNGELHFRKKDWWLVVPAVLHAINLAPYYLMPIAEKRAHIIDLYQNFISQKQFRGGIFPAYVFSFLRVAWSAIFVILNFTLIARFKKQANHKLLADNKELLNWLTVFNSLLTLLLAAALFTAAIAFVNKTYSAIVDFALGLSVLGICLQLFGRPKLLYGLYQPIGDVDINKVERPAEYLKLSSNETIDDNTVVNAPLDTSVADITFIQFDSYGCKKKIEALFAVQKPFLKTDYSLDQLVIDTQIPRYTLSAFINREYGMNFREFLNRYRVDFFKDNLNDPHWKNLTLEGIALECGFRSRSTFIKSFKLVTGKTPSEYLKERNMPDILKVG